MASALARVTDFVPATPILSAEVDAEFNQLVNLLNGTSTAVKGVMKVSDTGDPPLELNQLSTGPILKGFQAGVEKFRIRNDGSIRTPGIYDTNDNEQLLFSLTAAAINEFTMKNAALGNAPQLQATGGDTNIGIALVPKGSGVVKIQAGLPVANEDAANKLYVDNKRAYFVAAFKIDDPSTFPLTDQSALAFVRIPNIASGFITRVHILFASGSHTAGGSVTFRVFINGAGVGSGVAFTDTNNTAFTFYAEDFADQAISDGSSMTVVISARSGTVTERNVTINVEGYQNIKSP